jgi:hypothetical protein
MIEVDLDESISGSELDSDTDEEIPENLKQRTIPWLLF